MKLKIEPQYFFFKYLWLYLLIPDQLLQFIAIAVTLLLMMVLISNFKIEKEMYYFLIWIAVAVISLIYSFVLNGDPDERIFADFLRLGVMFCSIFIYGAYYNKLPINFKKIKRYMFVNFLILTGIVVFYLIRDGQNFVLFGRNLSGVDLLTNSIKTRLFAFLDYATLITTTIVVIVPVVFTVVKNKMFQIVILGMLTIPIILSASRIGLLSMLILLVLVGISLLRAWFTRLWFIVVFIVGIVAIGYVVTENIILELLNSRISSNTARFIIYDESISKILDVNLLIGAGVTEMASVGTWLGSHSMYIAYLYRSGIVGLFVIIIGYIALFKKLEIEGRYYLMALAVFFIFETIDPLYIHQILWFSALGLYKRYSDKI